jgi:Stage II sporulation protein E (SpoIIE)
MFVIDLGAILERVEASAPVDAVKVVATTLAEMIGATEVTFLVADFSGRSVVRLSSAGRVDGARTHGVEQAETLPLAGTLYDQVLRTQQFVVERLDQGARVVVPVTDRGDAIGLLEMTLSQAPTPDEIVELGSAGHALAYVVIAARQFTDVFEWGYRSTPFNLAAEIQRRLLPLAYTCEAARFSLAGWLEPAASVGGDTFDYTLDRTSLQISITDAVGHQVAAALLATLLVGSLRNGRRGGLSLEAQACFANDSLAENAPPGQFVTGQVLRGPAFVARAG